MRPPGLGCGLDHEQVSENDFRSISTSDPEIGIHLELMNWTYTRGRPRTQVLSVSSMPLRRRCALRLAINLRATSDLGISHGLQLPKRTYTLAIPPCR